MLTEEKALQTEVTSGRLRLCATTTTTKTASSNSAAASGTVDSSGGTVILEETEEEESFEFLTSTFGGVLPIDHHNNNSNNNNSNPKGLLSFSVTMATPYADACSPIASVLPPPPPPPAQGSRASTVASETRATSVAVVVTRGVCSFDLKAYHVQQAGGNMMIVVDPLDGPLQRLGGTFPLAGYVGIPR